MGEKKIILREGNPSLALESQELQYFCDLIREMAGISLTPAKSELVKTRLRKRLMEKNISTFAEYRSFLQTLPDEHPEWQEYINLLTTNKTDFFREPKHFDFLIHKFLPEWLNTSEKTLKIWSAASSTGEEAYTLAMLLTKHLPAGREFEILGTDIDTNVLEIAQNGVYSMNKYNEIPSEYSNMITIGQENAEGWFRIKPEVKQRVKFQKHNLIEHELVGSDMFNLVLCRNVLIYFSPDTIKQVCGKLYSSTKSNGYCLIGHSETFQNVSHKWINGGPSIYKKTL